MALYMIGFTSYGATLVFYSAIFPRLARNTSYSRELKERYQNGEISLEVYETEESLEKNRICNIATVGPPYAYPVDTFPSCLKVHSNIGYIATLALNLSILLPRANDPKVDNYVLVL